MTRSTGLPERQAQAIVEGLQLVNLENIATKQDLAELRVEIQKVKNELLKWMITLLLGQTAVLAALVKLL